MKEIKKLSKAGTLNESVVATIEKQLKEKLTVLDILGEWPNSKITEEEMEARIQQWRKQGKINARWVDGSIRRQITEEILKERQSKLSSDERARRQAAWQQDQQTVLDLTVDLGRYAPNRAAEKEIIKEFSGNMAQTRLVECLKTANSYEKAELINPTFPVRGINHRFCWGLTPKVSPTFQFPAGASMRGGGCSGRRISSRWRSIWRSLSGCV
jgi:hypothetical protein